MENKSLELKMVFEGVEAEKLQPEAANKAGWPVSGNTSPWEPGQSSARRGHRAERQGVLPKGLPVLAVVGSIGVFCIAGCSTLPVADVTEGGTELHTQVASKDGLSIGVAPLKEKDLLIKYFGVDLRKQSILPIYITIDNQSGASFLFLKNQASIALKGHQDTREHEQLDIPIEERKPTEGDYAAAAFFGGLAGALTLDLEGDSGRAIRHNILAKRLNTDTLSPSEHRSGFLYFHVPKEIEDTYILTIKFMNLETEETASVEFQGELLP